MVKSRSINQIAHEITDNLKPHIFEACNEECNMDVVEYSLVESELSLFAYYDRFFWVPFEKAQPEEEGHYWLTVVTEYAEVKTVLTFWYGMDSLRYWKRKFKKLVAWKHCILPEPYNEYENF